MQIEIYDSEYELFNRLDADQRDLTRREKEVLSIFSNRIVEMNRAEKFNRELVKLKTYFENELKEGCSGIACSECKLNFVIGGKCSFRQLKLVLQDMEV